MKVLFISTFYPPVALGGYEVECAGVAERLAERHEVRVLTSSARRGEAGSERDVERELTLLSPDAKGALRAPAAALGGVAAARRALAWQPDLVYAWNCSSIPHAAVRVIADSGAPLAFRVCEHWFGGLFTGDQYMRELLPAKRGPGRRVWAAGCQALNRARRCAWSRSRRFRAAISWNSEALERMVTTPAFVSPALERVGHSVPRYGDLYAAVERAPAPVPEIVFLGRVTPYKGLGVAIEALALLREGAHPTARLVVIGPEDDAYGQQMRRPCRDAGVGEAIGWEGQRTPAQSAAALGRAHALIVPSVWDEPFPLVRSRARSPVSRWSPRTSAGSARECTTRSTRSCSAEATCRPPPPRSRGCSRMPRGRRRGCSGRAFAPISSASVPIWMSRNGSCSTPRSALAPVQQRPPAGL